MSRRPLLALASAALLAVAPAALAAPSPKAAAEAQALFDEAMRLMKADKAAEACPKLEAAQALDPGMATQFRLAECYEQLRRFARAWALFTEVADAAKKEKMLDREQFARKRAAAIEGMVARLTLTVPEAVAALEGLEITRDGEPVDPSQWGRAVPLELGEHRIAARAPGKKPWETTVVAGDPSPATVTVGPLIDEAPAVVSRPPPPPPPAPPPKRSLIPGFVLGGAALAGVGVGAALLGLSAGERADAEALRGAITGGGGGCVAGASNFDSRCAQLASGWQSVDTLHNAGVGVLVGAGVLAAGAVTWFLLPAPKAPTTALQWHAVPALGPNGGALAIRGSF